MYRTLLLLLLLLMIHFLSSVTCKPCIFSNILHIEVNNPCHPLPLSSAPPPPHHHVKFYQSD